MFRFDRRYFDRDNEGGGGGADNSADDSIDNAIDNVIAQGELDEGGGSEPSTPESGAPSGGSEGAQGQQNTSGGGAPDNASAQQQPQGQQPAGATGGDQGQQQQQQGERELPPPGRDYGVNKAGDIIDKQGNIVAKAGAERRHWERSYRSETVVVPGLQREVSRLTQELAAARAATQAAQQAGLNDQESTTAIQLMAAWKKNPGDTLRWLLTEYQKAGNDISGLLGGEGAQQTGVGAIARLIDEKLKPFTEAQQQQQQSTQAQQEAAQEAQRFFGSYPDAVIHEAPIANLMQQYPSMSAEAAYWRLKAYVQQNGLDWNQPLAPQVLQRQQTAQGGDQGAPNSQQQQQQRQPAPMPNGVNGGAALSVPAPAVNEASDSVADIVRSAMRDAGYNT